jgi:hypothetical protein
MWKFVRGSNIWRRLALLVSQTGPKPRPAFLSSQYMQTASALMSMCLVVGVAGGKVTR